MNRIIAGQSCLTSSIATLFVLLVTLCPKGVYAEPVLPDLIPWESESHPSIHGGFLDVDELPGRALYRFNLAIPNVGDGPMELRIENIPDDQQDVYQRIFDSDGTSSEVFVGRFPVGEPSPFGLLNLVGIAQYNLREVTAGDGVGDIVASNIKTSHCLVDSIRLPDPPAIAKLFGDYLTCRTSKFGISVGFADDYRSFFTNQWIDVTEVPDDQYWLEVVIDPFDLLQESVDTNNVTRILVDLKVSDVLVPEPHAGMIFAVGLIGMLVCLRHQVRCSHQHTHLQLQRARC